MRRVMLLIPVLLIASSIAHAQDAMFARCSERVEDAATGICIPASSSPVLGALYPLSIDWFIDPTGNVGLGTTSPAARFDVAGDMAVNGVTVIDGTTRQWKGGINNGCTRAPQNSQLPGSSSPCRTTSRLALMGQPHTEHGAIISAAATAFSRAARRRCS